METSTRTRFFSILAIILLASAASAANAHAGEYGYYWNTCPQATTIIKNTVAQILKENRNLAGALLRLHFHDCFVRGCDASVLLNSPTKNAEKDAAPNTNSLRGFEQIDRIKAAIEAECPGIVSCADILALAARDAVVQVGGQSWTVDLGRKDGFVSRDVDATQKLPRPNGTFDELVTNFASVGFTGEEMVILSGAHTIGRATCSRVQPRLYDFNGVPGATDPSIDPKFARELKKKCPQNQLGSDVSMDATKNSFDNLYFKALLVNKGLFASDANLLKSPVGLELVTKYSKPGSSFPRDFAAAMRKMSNIEWASEGEVRRVCYAVNH